LLIFIIIERFSDFFCGLTKLEIAITLSQELIITEEGLSQ
jgi:hypothetical protein